MDRRRFLKATGLSSISEAKIQSDKKGDRYIALIEKPGRPAIHVLAEIFAVQPDPRPVDPRPRPR